MGTRRGVPVVEQLADHRHRRWLTGHCEVLDDEVLEAGATGIGRELAERAAQAIPQLVPPLGIAPVGDREAPDVAAGRASADCGGEPDHLSVPRERRLPIDHVGR